MLLRSSPTPARRAPENIAAVKDLMAMHLPKLASASSAATEEVKLTKAEVRLQSYCFLTPVCLQLLPLGPISMS